MSGTKPTTERTQNARIQLAIRALLASTALVAFCPSAGLAADGDIEARVDALEAKLDRILDRLEAQDASLTAAEKTTLKDAAYAISNSAAAPNAKASVIQNAAYTVPDAGTPRPILAELDTPGGVSAQAQADRDAIPAKERPKRKGLGFSAGDVDFTFKGYVKLDATVTRFSDGDLPTSNIGRDFYIPSLVPVGGEGNGADFDFNPRETRFLFAVDTERGGHDIGGLIELDFQVTSDGNERVSNSFTPRMRQAYVTIDNWLIGQAWTTFQDVGALPDNLDFIGPTEGTVFIRQPMIRYTKGPFQIAIEQPETEVTGPAGERLLPGDDIAPDVVLRYNKKGDWGHVSLAGILRALHSEEDMMAGAMEDTALGFGVSASGKLKVGARDDFRFMATYGEGIGRYIGVNIVNDAAIQTNGELQTIATYSGFASYRHFWTKNLRSNLTGGFFKADNPVSLTGDGVTDEVYSVHANLIYTPIEKFDVGVEYIYANRRLEDGQEGNMNRVQFSTKYSF
ncbi:MAG: DcaP family trimeric outer membrane transporter [Pseudomonadota bacterium]